MDLGPSEELAESVGELSHELLVEGLSTLWVCVIKTIVYRLSNYVIKFLEELLLALLVVLGIFDKCERYIICRNPIQ